MQEFPLFPRLHYLLSSRANITPPQITTGTGPSGRSVIHLQVESESSGRTPNSAQQTPTTPQHPASSSTGGNVQDEVNTPSTTSAMPLPSTFGSHRISSQPSSSSSRTSTGAAQPSALDTAVARARANFHPRKRTIEDRLFDMHEYVLCLLCVVTSNEFFYIGKLCAQPRGPNVRLFHRPVERLL